MALRIVSVGCFLGALPQLGASASVAVSVRPDGTVGIAQTGEEGPNLLEESLFRRVGVDYDGQLNEAQHHGQVHGDGQRRDNGHKITVEKARGFSCAEVRAKYDSEVNQKHTSEEVLCKDISRANGTASCCTDSPKDCCKDPAKCTLDDAFSALDMQDLCRKSALIEPIQVDGPLGDEEGDGVADNGAAEVLGDKDTTIKLDDDNMGTASIMPTIDWTAGLPEQKRQVEQKLEALRDENLKHPRSQVEDSLLSGAYLTYALEELRRGDLSEQSQSRNLLNARSNASKPIPLMKGAIPNNLEPHEFQQRVAGGAAGLFMNLVQGKGIEESLRALGTTVLEIVGLINPFLSFFAGIFMSFLGGNSNDALIKKIMKEVDKKIRRDRARTLNLKLKDLVEELSWMPGMVEKAVPEVGIAWWLIVQHDLATKKSLVFDDKCIGKKPWTSITKPALMEANSSFQRLATIGAHGGDAPPDNPVKPALVEDDTSSNRSIIRTHDAGTSLDNSLHSKGSEPKYDDCDRWNHDAVAVEIQWIFAELQLNVLSTISGIRPVFMDDMKPRILKLAHEYAGLIQQSTASFKDWRLREIHKKYYYHCRHGSYCRYNRQEGVHDKFLGKVFHNTNHANYKNGISNELETRKTQRVAKLMCFARAAAGQNVGDCGYTR